MSVSSGHAGLENIWKVVRKQADTVDRDEPDRAN